MLQPNLPTIHDAEGAGVPAGLPRVIDAHVHIFPEKLFSAIRRWFDDNAWHIRYALTTPEVFDFLLSRGVDHIIALQYAHTAGIARELNHHMLEACRRHPGRVTGMATVFPGERDAGRILQEAFDAGLGGVKLHAHVQCFEINSDDMDDIFDVCQSHRKPVVIHIGKEPKSPVYRCDPYKICGADKLERVLKDFPGLNICVPHLGFSEIHEYKRLIEKYDHLWLDTTMALTDYFDIEKRFPLQDYRMDRILYGSDFPNIPYAWDRELKCLRDSGLSHDQLDRILNRNATELFGLPGRP
jgi:predicted TIM-barrel fold metal-dependent hydrolase